MSPDPNFASHPTSAASVAAPQGFFSRLVGVYVSPGETFQEIGRAPRVLVPLLTLIIVGGLVGFLVINRIGVQTLISKRFEQAVAAGRMTQEAANQQLERMSSGPAATFVKLSILVPSALWYVVLALIIAGIAKLISMLMGVENGFKPVFAVTLYSLLAVLLVSSLLFVILIYLKNPEEIDLQNPLGSNLGALLTILGLDGLPKFIKALAAWVDLFYIWKIVLLTIGFVAVSRRLKTSTAAIITTGVAVVIALIGASFSAMFM